MNIIPRTLFISQAEKQGVPLFDRLPHFEQIWCICTVFLVSLNRHKLFRERQTYSNLKISYGDSDYDIDLFRFACDKCGDKFLGEYKYGKHMREVHAESYVPCFTCIPTSGQFNAPVTVRPLFFACCVPCNSFILQLTYFNGYLLLSTAFLFQNLQMPEL